MPTGDFDQNIINIYNGNTGGEYLYHDGNNGQSDIHTHELKVDQGNMSYTALTFLYKGEWHTIEAVMERMEKMEKFIDAFIETFDKGITLDRIAEMRNIWFDDHDNTISEWDIETAGAPEPIEKNYVLDDKLFEIEIEV